MQGERTVSIDTKAGEITMKRSYVLSPSSKYETASICIPPSAEACIDLGKIEACLGEKLGRAMQENRAHGTSLRFAMSSDGRYRLITIGASIATDNNPSTNSVRDWQLERSVDAIGDYALKIINDDITRITPRQEEAIRLGRMLGNNILLNTLRKGEKAPRGIVSGEIERSIAQGEW